jgi:hypothetical protein
MVNWQWKTAMTALSKHALKIGLQAEAAKASFDFLCLRARWVWKEWSIGTWFLGLVADHLCGTLCCGWLSKFVGVVRA